MLMAILLILVVGAVAGWLAGLIMKGSGFGLLGDIGIGIVGGFVGGFLFRLLGLQAESLVGGDRLGDRGRGRAAPRDPDVQEEVVRS